MNIEEFRKMKDLKQVGLSQYKTAISLNVSSYQIKRFWNMSEEEFLDSLNDNKDELSRYDDFILDIVKLTPTIPDSNVYYKIREKFPDFSVSEKTFRKYMKILRAKTGYDRFKKISTRIRETPKPGEEAQVDFGQYKILDMYGKRRLLYFIVIVLRYSQLKYVYFSTEDFNTKKAITAHKNAFRFFGGIPEILLYDQDKVFAVSENYGNLVLVDEFQEFLMDYGLSIAMCSGYHPEGKGTVENYVKIVKENFLMGRVYTGIDSLNSACLEWLDNTENNHYIASCGKTPHELFMDEATLLRKIPLPIHDSDKVEYLKVTKNHIRYKYSKYEMPLGYEGTYVHIESDGINLIVKDKDNGKLICTHKLATSKNERVLLTPREESEGDAEFIVKNYFKDNDNALKFLDAIRIGRERYYKKACVKLRMFTKIYSKEQLEEAFEYAVTNDDLTWTGLIVHLITKYGDLLAKKAMGRNYFYYQRLIKGGEVNGSK